VAPESALSLRAEDAADLAVISACLQDALVVVGDLSYDRAMRSFVLVANRFRWEGSSMPAAEPMGYQRTLCAVAFSEVDAVAYRGFRRSGRDRILSLLTVQPQGNGAGTVIDLDFSGGAAIRLKVAAIRCHARDLGEPWPTTWQPAHPEDMP
jgi:hypothetical protein